MKIVVVAAVSDNGFIGKGNRLPWSIPEEMKHFHEVTAGHVMVVGHRTWKSLPKKMREYPGMVIVSSDPGKDFLSAIEVIKVRDYEEVCVIGGAYVYAQAIPIADELIISYVHRHVEGDVKMPSIDYNQWTPGKVKSCEEFTTIWWKRKNV